MIYKKLRRTWSHGYSNYIPNFREVFPELKNVNTDELCDRFIELNVEFYEEIEEPVRSWIRFTLPFALILMVLMILSLPLVFMFTGKWSYPFGRKNPIFNWFRSLKLID